MTQKAVEAAWNQEIARRIEDLDSGKVKTVPWDAVRLKISFILNKKQRSGSKEKVQH